MVTSIIYAVLAYFLGNILGGKLLEKIYKEDLSKTGSGNVGARNAGRVLGARSFVFVQSVEVAQPESIAPNPIIKTSLVKMFFIENSYC